MQGMFARYLEQSLSLFTQRQSQFPNLLSKDPMHPMTELAQHNIKIWADVQQSFLRAAGFTESKSKDE